MRLPWSHWLTLSSLHAVIGSMLGVLVQSLLQLPAVLADFYLSRLLEEEKPDAELGSDDDESFFLPQVQVRVSLLSANGAEMSGTAGSKDPSLPHLLTCRSSAWWCLITSVIVPCGVDSKARRKATSVGAEGVGSGNT